MGWEAEMSLNHRAPIAVAAVTCAHVREVSARHDPKSLRGGTPASLLRPPPHLAHLPPSSALLCSALLLSIACLQSVVCLSLPSNEATESSIVCHLHRRKLSAPSRAGWITRPAFLATRVPHPATQPPSIDARGAAPFPPPLPPANHGRPLWALWPSFTSACMDGTTTVEVHTALHRPALLLELPHPDGATFPSPPPAPKQASFTYFPPRSPSRLVPSAKGHNTHSFIHSLPHPLAHSPSPSPMRRGPTCRVVAELENV